MIPRQSDVISYYIGLFLYRLLYRWKPIHLCFLSYSPSLPRTEILSHSAHCLNIVTLSFPRPLSCIPFLSLFLHFLSSPLPTPAVFHLNISSSCLAASAACQVSSRSQGPTLKWSMEVIFRGVCVCVCVRKREPEREKERGGDEKERQLGWGLRHRVEIRSEKVEKTWEW